MKEKGEGGGKGNRFLSLCMSVRLCYARLGYVVYAGFRV